MRASQGLSEALQRREPVVCSARAAVHAVGNSVEFVLGVDRQVRALGQVLSQQPVGVLARAALPGAVWVAEVHRHAGTRCQLLVARQLLELVLGQAVAHRLGNRVQLGRKARQRRGGRGIDHLRHQHQAARALHQHADRGVVAAPLLTSPSQWPGITRSSTLGGRTWMLTISGICPRQSVPRVRGSRVLRP